MPQPVSEMLVQSVNNGILKLDYLSSAGPRIVGAYLHGSTDNLFAQTPQVHWNTPYGEYRIIGGHRLWHAPENFPRTNVPDDQGLTVEESAGRTRLTGPVEAPTGIQKIIDIALQPARSAARIHHKLVNHNLWAVELAPWALTQLPTGGFCILPQQVGSLDPSGLLPNRQLVIWPYAQWKDPRLHLGEEFIFIRADALMPPLKVGYLNRAGWVAYLRGGVLFVKRFTPQPELPHVDMGCNAESYCNDTFIEVETLGPLQCLEPGASVEHVEEWEFLSGLEYEPTLDGIRQLLAEIQL